jgi:3-deoxy-D-manno-octulosonate 8-phosphate phosphatase (KDO 8-P phosphatase)
LKLTPALKKKVLPIKLAIFDVDGVLTDGGLRYGPTGEALKVFNTLDGHGLKMLAESGVQVAIISGRSSKALEMRAKDLGIRHLVMGVANKADAYRAMLKKLKLAAHQVASIGDDIVDLPILLHCGFSAAVPAAPEDLKTRVDLVTKNGGGHGAAREFCEVIMRGQGTYDGLLKKYLA